jgi:hypothetical protein
MRNIKELDVVALLKAIPEKGLTEGQVGTIVQKLDDDTSEVEFANKKGETLITIAIANTELMLLHFDPVLV